MTESSFQHLNPAFFPSEVTPVATEEEAYEQAYEDWADESAAIAEEQFSAGAEVVLNDPQPVDAPVDEEDVPEDPDDDEDD